jgi:methionine sulfoxide reductase heme-binding subunit
MTFALNSPALWYATRATGLVTLLLLTVSMLLGIVTAGRLASEKWPRFLTIGLHRNVTLLVLVFLALHVGTTVVDTYTSIPATLRSSPSPRPTRRPGSGWGPWRWTCSSRLW